MVYGAMKSHFGHIEVESVLGQGCTFHLYFPLMNADESIQNTAGMNAVEYFQGSGESILLADDESMLREVTADILECFGYCVFQAEGGLDTMEILNSHQDKIKLAILDVVMPQCSGVQLAQKIRDMGIDIPIIFVTGYDKSQIYSHGEAAIKNSMGLSKPVQYDELHKHIRMFLDAN